MLTEQTWNISVTLDKMSSTFSPTTAELALVSLIFDQGDPQKHGILTGDVAVKVFAGAKLEPNILGDIWSIADEHNNGWLPKKGVAIAVRLIGWAQKGEKVTKTLINKRQCSPLLFPAYHSYRLLIAGPLPSIDGVSPLTHHNTGVSLSKSPPPGFPPFTAQDRTKFQALFMKSGPANGLLSGKAFCLCFIHFVPNMPMQGKRLEIFLSNPL